VSDALGTTTELRAANVMPATATAAVLGYIMVSRQEIALPLLTSARSCERHRA
jgi:hypothetical protein